MPSHAREVHSNLFMVRVWPEEVDDRRVEWRGKIQHVTSGEALYFREWGSMLAFLQSVTPGQAVEGAQQPDWQQDGHASEGEK
jgi:hypothetical protein